MRDGEEIERVGSLANIGIWEYNPQDVRVICSKEVYRILEIEDGMELDLDGILKCYADEASDKIRKAIDLTIREGKSFIRDAEIVVSSGKRKWIRTQGEAVQDQPRGRPDPY